MTNPVMTVAAECTYSVGDSDARQACNEAILEASQEHLGETCETTSEFSADHSARTLTLMCNGDAGREQNERREQRVQSQIERQERMAERQLDFLSLGLRPLWRWVSSFF